MARTAPVAALLGLVAANRVYRLLARGALRLDTGIGRRLRPFGPVAFPIAAPRELVFDVIATPYLGRTPRALQSELEVWERGSDMVLAAHFTPVKCGVTMTLETVRFTRPERIDFRLVRGPVPHVVETFLLEPAEDGTRLTWQGERGRWSSSMASATVGARSLGALPPDAASAPDASMPSQRSDAELDETAARRERRRARRYLHASGARDLERVVRSQWTAIAPASPTSSTSVLSSRTSTRQFGFLRCSVSPAASPECSAASGSIGSLGSRT